MNDTDTVRRRIARTRTAYTSTQLVLGLALVAATAFTLLFLQEPTAHDSLHDFRHATGIACH